MAIDGQIPFSDRPVSCLKWEKDSQTRHRGSLAKSLRTLGAASTDAWILCYVVISAKVRSFEVHAVWINASWSVWVNLPVPSWCMDSQPSKAKCLRRKLLHILHIASGVSQAWYNGFQTKTRWSPRTRMLTRMLLVQMSIHMVMQSRTIPFRNSLFEQSCACFTCYQSAVWGGKCRVWSVECEVRSVECKV